MIKSTFWAKFINKLHRAWWFITRPSTEGVKVLVFNNQEEILMVRLTYYPDTWTFPGGGVDGEENPETAAKREVKEEVGIKLNKIHFVTTLDFDHEYKKDTVFVYKTTVDNVEIEIDEKEVAEANWFALNTLPSMGNNVNEILNSVR